MRGAQAAADEALTAMTADRAETVLEPLAGPDTLLCIDGSGALRMATVKMGATTRYLDNYIAWLRMRQGLKEGVKPGRFVVSGLGRQFMNT